MFSDPRTGAALVLAHLSGIGAAMLLLLVWVGMGARIRTLIAGAAWQEPPLPALVRWPVDAALGAGGLASVLLGMGAAGLLRPWMVFVATAVPAAWAHREVLTAATDLRRAAAFLLLDKRALVPGAAGFALAGLLLAGAVAPPTDWDALMYHLRIPLWFLETGRVALPPDSFHVGLVGASHFSTLPLLAAGLLAGPAVVQVLVLGLVLAGTYEMARVVKVSSGGRWLALAAVLGCPAIVLVAITARVDVSLMLPLVAAHLVLLEPGPHNRIRAVYLAAILVGIGLAMKPLAAAYALGLVPLGLLAARSWRPALAAAAIAIVVALPWLFKNQLLAGAFFFPRGAPGWFEPWLAEIFGGHVRPEWLDTSIRPALRQSREPLNLPGLFAAPGPMTIEAEGRYYALSPLLAVAPLLLLRWRSHRLAITTGLVGVVYLIVLATYGQINLRYLLPAVPPLAVASVAALDRIIARIRSPGRMPMLIGLGLVALAPLGPALLARFGQPRVLVRHAVGALPASAVWQRHPDLPVRLFAPVIGSVQRLVPADGRILMFWEARGLPLEREVLIDARLSNWSYLAQSPAAADCLAGRGITHILANSGGTQYYIRRGADSASFRLREYADFRERCAIAVTRVAPGFELLELRTFAPAAGAGLR